MKSNLRSRVAEFEAGYFLLFFFFFFPVGFLKSGGWCLASFVEYGWSVGFILFPGVVCGERKGLYYSVSCCGVTEYCGMMSGACVGSVLVGATASCAVAGCAPGDSVVVAVFVVSSFCVSFICLFVCIRPCSCCRSE